MMNWTDCLLFEAAQAAGVDAYHCCRFGSHEFGKTICTESGDSYFYTGRYCELCNGKCFHTIWGAKRIVLARELSLDDIAQIRAKIPADLEIETFVHRCYVHVLFRPLLIVRLSE